MRSSTGFSALENFGQEELASRVELSGEIAVSRSELAGGKDRLWSHGDSWCSTWPGHEAELGADAPFLYFAKHTGYGGYSTWNRGARVIEDIRLNFIKHVVLLCVLRKKQKAAKAQWVMAATGSSQAKSTPAAPNVNKVPPPPSHSSNSGNPGNAYGATPMGPPMQQTGIQQQPDIQQPMQQPGMPPQDHPQADGFGYGYDTQPEGGCWSAGPQWRQ
ncbi:hypothetical protein ColKHC_03885 [Colletotrichum higginsianum]|nr:hypothetical protein ColKHC_03885 [Colletotrichum higginsianum]